MWLLLTLPALAGPIGQPLPDPQVERVTLALRAETETAGLRAEGCEAEEGCDAVLEGRTWAAELSVALLRGVGVYGVVGRRIELVQAAQYSGVGRTWALGGRLALPITGALGVAADARYTWSATEGAAVEGALAGPGSQRWQSPRLSLMGTLGQPDDGGLGWLGVQTSPGFTLVSSPLGSLDGAPLTELTLKPELPVSAVFGLAGVSEELGLPWRRSARISAGAEAWLGQTSGLGAWLALGY